MRFVLTVGLCGLMFLLQLAVMGLDLWQLAHFYQYNQFLMALDCLVIPVCAWNAWRLPQTMRGLFKIEREHKARMRHLSIELQQLAKMQEECARWMMKERGAILAHIAQIEEKHPEQAAALRQRMAEAERFLYGNH